MCGRYTLTTPLEELVENLGVADVRLEGFGPRYNIAPTQPAPVLVRGKEGLALGWLRWGFAPQGPKGPLRGGPRINARAETAGRISAFRESFHRRRCLIPVDGFYEWASAGEAEAPGGSRKVPHWIHRPDLGPFTLAGLWEKRSGVGSEAGAFTILTTAANSALRTLHDRMPVVIPTGSRDHWLDPLAEVEGLERLLVPAPVSYFEAWPVSSEVNTPAVDDPSCILRLTGA